MTVDETWPHVDSYHDRETEQHVRLKNLAVHWLLSGGFSASDIVDEHTVQSDSKMGRTDIYASNKELEMFIECEQGQATLSRGGSIPAWEDKPVFVFRDDGVYDVEKETQTADPSPMSPSTETISREVLVMNRLCDLPDAPTDT